MYFIYSAKDLAVAIRVFVFDRILSWSIFG